MPGEEIRFIPASGVTATEAPGAAPVPANLRKILVDAFGRQIVVPAGGGAFLTQIFGVAGDGATLNSFRQILLKLRDKGGWRAAVTGVSAVLQPLTALKTYHVEVTVHAWVRAMAVGVGVATVGDAAGNGATHLSPGKVYEFIPQDANEIQLAFIKDTGVLDGVIYVSQVEN